MSDLPSEDLIRLLKELPFDNPTCDKTLRDRVCELLLAGNFRETAAAACGVKPALLRKWMIRGANGDQPYARFCDAMDEAEARAEVLGVQAITATGADDWKALAWRLERKSPARWGARVKIEVENELNTVLDKLQQTLSPDEYQKVLAAIASETSVAAIGAATGTTHEADAVIGRLSRLAGEDGTGEDPKGSE